MDKWCDVTGHGGRNCFRGESNDAAMKIAILRTSYIHPWPRKPGLYDGMGRKVSLTTAERHMLSMRLWYDEGTNRVTYVPRGMVF